MDAAFAAGHPLEVFDYVRDVHPRAVDTDLVEGFVQDAPSRSDEGLAGAVLLVARLLADHHHFGTGGTFAEHGLGARQEQVTRAAAPGRLAQVVERSRRLGRQEWRGVPRKLVLSHLP